jgi:hypothetical protein
MAPTSPNVLSNGDILFNPDWKFKAAFGAIMVITLMAALDATSLSVALPVGSLFITDQ